jgi:predicted transcriptional regulator
MTTQQPGAAHDRPPRHTVLRLDDLADRLDDLAEQTGASGNALINAALRVVLPLSVATWARDARDLRTREGRKIAGRPVREY